MLHFKCVRESGSNSWIKLWHTYHYLLYVPQVRHLLIGQPLRSFGDSGNKTWMFPILGVVFCTAMSLSGPGCSGSVSVSPARTGPRRGHNSSARRRVQPDSPAARCHESRQQEPEIAEWQYDEPLQETGRSQVGLDRVLENHNRV